MIASSVGPQNAPEGMDMRLTALRGVLHKTIAALQQNGEIDANLPDHYCDFALLSAAAGGLMSMCCPLKPERDNAALLQNLRTLIHRALKP